MKNIFNLLKRYGFFRSMSFALSEVYARIWQRTILHSFSQNREDLILDQLVGYKKIGYYVDIGAYDPYRFSNTMRFYERGWRGINIEPDTARWTKFQKVRTRDINLNIGIATRKGSLSYYEMDPQTLSTFDERQAEAYQMQGFARLSTRRVAVRPLGEVLRAHKGGSQIDFMSIDVEGMEMKVLSSNDWKVFRPHFLCIESADYSKTEEGKQNYQHIGTFLTQKGYIKILDNGLNSFYTDALRRT